MNIIRPGIDQEQEFNKTCEKCKCHFAFFRKEAEQLGPDRLLLSVYCVTGVALKIKCPTCGKECFVYDP